MAHGGGRLPLLRAQALTELAEGIPRVGRSAVPHWRELVSAPAMDPAHACNGKLQELELNSPQLHLSKDVTLELLSRGHAAYTGNAVVAQKSLRELQGQQGGWKEVHGPSRASGV